MKFTKMQGLGNDFIVIDGPVEPSREEVVAWCDRRRGVGADGLLVVTPMDSNRVGMRYWNADGGEAEMCGNGLRCVARYAVAQGWVDTMSLTIDTAVGLLPATVKPDGSVRALLGRPTAGETLELDSLTLHTVDMGNPHAVQWVVNPATADVSTIGPRIETDPEFVAGTNAEFAAVVGTDEIELRVWERGVGETLACGTGAAATAFLAHEQGLVGSEVKVKLLGGTLLVILDDAGAWLEGPAEFVFSGSLY
jgi:diaminopimelate epimerase